MSFDAVVIGSGFGGAMVAYRLLAAGKRVLMIERGNWVDRAHAWEPAASLEMTESYAKDIPYRCEQGGHGKEIGGYACVGGPSVFYGCVAFRFRERDFEGDPDVVAGSGARWPFDYQTIAPYYDRAEQLLGISGDDFNDPTRPARTHAYPQEPAALAPISSRLAESAINLGLHPFCLPLAINHGVADQRVVEFADGPVARVEFPVRLRSACIACRTCDTYACKLEAKNDVATMMIDPMIVGLTRVMRDGTTNLAKLELWPNTVVVGLDVEAGRVVRARLRRRDRTHVETIEADQFILAAGALGTPHLVLASGLHEHSPARDAVGRYLMRHDNAMVFGVFPRRPDPDHRFHKQVAIHDWYFGEPGADDVEGMTKLGGVQQMMTPPKELVRAHLPIGTKTAIGAFTEQLTGLLCIAEDQPRPENRVTLDPGVRDIYDLPQLVIEHAYSDRDERAVSALVRRAKRVLRETGAWFFHTHRVKTFSHAVGTVRMGTDPETSPLDENCKFRGLANLWITDGSALPMSAGVNPSLTIAANALRAADAIVREVA